MYLHHTHKISVIRTVGLVFALDVMPNRWQRRIVWRSSWIGWKLRVSFMSCSISWMASHIDNWCAFGPRKASEVEKPSSRGVSSLHRWSLMLLPVLWLMPLCALCTHVCVSTTLGLLSFASLPHCCSFPELGTMTQTDLSASLLHLDNIYRTNK